MIANNRSILRSLAIAGFKSIVDQKISFNQDVTVIIGANGSGKSNLLSFFQMLNNMMTNSLQQFVGKMGSSQSLLYYGKKDRTLSASLEFSNSHHTNTYSFSLVRAVRDTLIFSEESVISDGRKIELGSGQIESLLCNEQQNTNTIYKMILNLCRFYQFHDTSSDAFLRNSALIENNRYLYSNGGNLAAYLYLLKNTSEEYRLYYNRIIETIQYIMPQFNDFSLEPQKLNPRYISLNWFEKGVQDYLWGAHQISDGSLRFMAIATLLLQPPKLLPNVIIIDEPELGLHPQAIDLLGNMISTAGQNAQVIVATQSPRLLDCFDTKNILVAERDTQHKCSVFKKLDGEELSEWLEEYSPSQLWDKNVLGGQP
jgi:predicted ATPase